MACKVSMQKGTACSYQPLRLHSTVEIDAKFFPVIYPPLDSNNVVYLRTALINYSKDTITYQTMTCSKEWMYTVAPSNLLEIQMRYDCTANTLMTRQLAPWDTLYQNIVIRIKKKSRGIIKGKIGFGHITIDPSIEWEGYENYKRYRDNLFEARHNPENIIWGREIVLKRKK